MNLGYRVGDIITVGYIYRPDIAMARIKTYAFMTDLTIVGFVEQWPGYAPTGVYTVGTGEHVRVEQYLAVANFGYIQRQWEAFPYEVWMRTNTDTNNFFREYSYENGLLFAGFFDTRGALVESRSDPILQGLNGVLTMSFIVILIICFTGFLIYWLLSIRSRVLQFGIFRAMGMSMRGIIGLLISEQVLITLMAI